MTHTKKRRFPSDRLKLHALLDKRRQELSELQELVSDLEAAVIEADHTAIHETTDAYSITPDQLSELLAAMRSGHPLPTELLDKLMPIGADGSEIEETKECDAHGESPAPAE